MKYLYDNTNQKGHREILSTEPLNELLKLCRGYEKKSVYAWLKGSGDILHGPSDDLDSLLKIKVNEEDSEKWGNLYLVEFRPDQIVKTIYRIIKRDRLVGGHAVGGGPTLETNDDICGEFGKFLQKVYKGFNETKIVIRDDKPTIEHENVKAWLVKSVTESGKKKHWSTYVSMIKRWNNDYHDVHLGDYYHATDAIEEAVAAFIRYQYIEFSMEDI